MKDNDEVITIKPNADDDIVSAVVSVDYEEFKPWTFKGVDVTVGDDTTRFESLEEAYSFAHEKADIVLNSSSVGDYIEDRKLIN